MGIQRQLYRLIFLYLMSQHVVAFGPRLESLKGGNGCRSSRTAIAGYEEREREHPDQNSKRRRSSPYHEDPYMPDNIDSFHANWFNVGDFLVDSAMFGIDNPFDILPTSTDNELLFDFCTGNECVECSIPEEYKRVDNPIDVLVYLGIQRVKPIVASQVDD